MIFTKYNVPITMYYYHDFYHTVGSVINQYHGSIVDYYLVYHIAYRRECPK
mgnify:CR=1 FL=1